MSVNRSWFSVISIIILLATWSAASSTAANAATAPAGTERVASLIDCQTSLRQDLGTVVPQQWSASFSDSSCSVVVPVSTVIVLEDPGWRDVGASDRGNAHVVLIQEPGVVSWQAAGASGR